MLIPGLIGVEMQCNLWMFLNMLNLKSIRLAEDQDGIIFPHKPNWTRLRGQMRINSRQPFDVFLPLTIPHHRVEIRLQIRQMISPSSFLPPPAPAPPSP